MRQFREYRLQKSGAVGHDIAPSRDRHELSPRRALTIAHPRRDPHELA
jgi:hypothetical protein